MANKRGKSSYYLVTCSLEELLIHQHKPKVLSFDTFSSVEEHASWFGRVVPGHDPSGLSTIQVHPYIFLAQNYKIRVPPFQGPALR